MNNTGARSNMLSSPRYILFFIVVFKLIIIYWYTGVLYKQNPVECVHHFVFIGGDTKSYVEPFENLITKGKFYSINEKGQETFIGRGPYFGLSYFIFRFFAAPDYAFIAMGILQILLDCFAAFLLYKLIQKHYKNLNIAIPYFLLAICFIPITILTVHLTTESICLSLSIISFYYFLDFLESKRKKTFWLSAILFCWMCALKPYLLPAGFVLFFIAWLKKGLKMQSGVNYLLMYYLPLLIILTPYTIRNLVHYNKFVPVQDQYAGYGYNEGDFALRRFIQSFGGSIIFWDQNAAGSFFNPGKRMGTQFKFPDYAFASCYTIDSLKDIAKKYATVTNSTSPDSAVIKEIAVRMNRYTDCLCNERPLLCSIQSRAEITSRFVLQNGPYFLPRTNIFELGFKALQKALYLALVLALFISTFKALKNFKNTSIAFLFALFCAWYPVIIFPIVFKADEWRYFDTAYPFLVFLAITLVLSLRKSENKKDNTVIY